MAIVLHEIRYAARIASMVKMNIKIYLRLDLLGNGDKASSLKQYNNTWGCENIINT